MYVVLIVRSNDAGGPALLLWSPTDITIVYLPLSNKRSFRQGIWRKFGHMRCEGFRDHIGPRQRAAWSRVSGLCGRESHQSHV